MKIERGEWTTFKKMEGCRPALGTLWEIRSGGLFMLTAFEHPVHGRDMVKGEIVSGCYDGCGVDVEVREVRLANACALEGVAKAHEVMDAAEPSRQPEAPVDVAYINHRGDAVVDTQAGDLVNYVDAADLEAVDQFFNDRSRSGAPEEEFGG